jgi:hypothetical protein
VSKPSQRAQRLLVDDLADKLKAEEDLEPQSVYAPVKSTNSDFLAIVDDALAKEEVAPSKKIKSSTTGSTLFICFIVLAFIALCVGGYIFTRQNGLIPL